MMDGKQILLALGKGLLWGSGWGAVILLGLFWGAADANLNRRLKQAVLVRAKAEGMSYAQIMWRDDDINGCPDGARCYRINGVMPDGMYAERVIWAKQHQKSP